MLTLTHILYTPPATIVSRHDRINTVAVCPKCDVHNKELGFALCVLKKKYGNKKVHDMLDKYVPSVSKYNKNDGAMVWEDKPKEKKPNGVRKRVRVHSKPDRYLKLTVEPVKNEPMYDLFEDFFNDLYKVL